MPSSTKTKATRKSAKPLSRKAIQERILDIDLAQTSALRDLELDIQGFPGTESNKVLQAARAALE